MPPPPVGSSASPSAASLATACTASSCSLPELNVPVVSDTLPELGAVEQIRDSTAFLSANVATLFHRHSIVPELQIIHTRLGQIDSISRTDRARLESTLTALEARANDDEQIKFETIHWVFSFLTLFIFALIYAVVAGCIDLFGESEAELTLRTIPNVRERLRQVPDDPTEDAMSTSSARRASRDITAPASTLAALRAPN